MISVTRTPKLSSTTTTSPRATRRPLTTTSTAPAAPASSTTLPGRRDSSSRTVRTVRPSSTVTSRGMSESRRMPAPSNGATWAPAPVLAWPPRSGKPAGSTATRVLPSAAPGRSPDRLAIRKGSCCSFSVIVPPGGHAEPEMPPAGADRTCEQVDAADGPEGRLIGCGVEAKDVAGLEADEVAGRDARGPEVHAQLDAHLGKLGAQAGSGAQLLLRDAAPVGIQRCENDAEHRDRVAETHLYVGEVGAGERDQVGEDKGHVHLRDDPDEAGVRLDGGEARSDLGHGLERVPQRGQEELEEVAENQELDLGWDPRRRGPSVPTHQPVHEAQRHAGRDGDDQAPHQGVKPDRGHYRGLRQAGYERAVHELSRTRRRHADKRPEGVAKLAAEVACEDLVHLGHDADLLGGEGVRPSELEPGPGWDS